MGYTHYFYGTGEKELHIKAVDTIRELLEEGWKNKIIAFEEDQLNKKPECTEKSIRFNGRGDDGHETFVFDISNKEFEFCKTARKPYDAIVTKVLLTLKHYHPDIQLSSDGDMEGEEWEEARKWAATNLNNKVKELFKESMTEQQAIDTILYLFETIENSDRPSDTSLGHMALGFLVGLISKYKE